VGLVLHSMEPFQVNPNTMVKIYLRPFTNWLMPWSLIISSTG